MFNEQNKITWFKNNYEHLLVIKSFYKQIVSCIIKKSSLKKLTFNSHDCTFLVCTIGYVISQLYKPKMK